jgi:hypothetical protein
MVDSDGRRSGVDRVETVTLPDDWNRREGWYE